MDILQIILLSIMIFLIIYNILKILSSMKEMIKNDKKKRIDVINNIINNYDYKFTVSTGNKSKYFNPIKRILFDFYTISITIDTSDSNEMIVERTIGQICSDIHDKLNDEYLGLEFYIIRTRSSSSE